MRFVIDEDMPRSLGPALRAAEHEVFDVRDYGLRDKPDEEIFRFAQQRQAVVVSEDLGFANVLRFPLGGHHGIVVGRFPATLRTATVVAELVRAVATVSESDLRGALMIVEMGQSRLRRTEDPASSQ